MKDSQLDKMSVGELMELRQRVDAMIATKKDRKRAELKEKLANLAKEEGYSIAELYNGMVGRKGGRTARSAGAAAKYQHPDNPSMTWSGRGRKPNWVKDLGGDIERFRVG